jgi:hypothetical protein
MLTGRVYGPCVPRCGSAAVVMMACKLRRQHLGVAIVALAATAGHAQVVPPAGYSGGTGEPGAAQPADPDAPRLTRVPDAALATTFHVDPTYMFYVDPTSRRFAATGHVKVVGAFEIAESKRRQLNAAWSAGFLPVTLLFSDGACYSFDADYNGVALSNARIDKVQCGPRREYEEPPAPPPPSDRSLTFIGTAWGYAAWADRQSGTTVVTAPHAKTFQPLFNARMDVMSIMAMNGPDYPGGNVTLVGKIDGRQTIVTLEVGF